MKFAGIAIVVLAIFSLGLLTPIMVQDIYGQGPEMEVIASGVTVRDSTAIPDWVKNQFDWYLKGEIDEKTLLTSMNWMFDNNIMFLSEKAAIEVNELKTRVSHLEELLSTSSEQHRIDPESGTIRFGDGVHGSIPPSEDVSGWDYAKKEAISGSGTDEQSAPYIPGGTVISSAVSGIATVDIPSTSGVPYKIFIVSGANTNINQLVQQVLRESYLETNKDLQFYADKVRHYNDLKDAIRDEAQMSRDLLAHELTHTIQQGEDSTRGNWDYYWVDITLPDGSVYNCSSFPKNDLDSRTTLKADLEECQDVQESIPKCIQKCDETYTYTLAFCAGLASVEAQQGCQIGAIEAKRFCEQKCHEPPPP